MQPIPPGPHNVWNYELPSSSHPKSDEHWGVLAIWTRKITNPRW